MSDILKIRKWLVISRAQFNIHLDSMSKVSRIKDKRVFRWDDKIVYLDKIAYICFFDRDNIHVAIMFENEEQVKVSINEIS